MNFLKHKAAIKQGQHVVIYGASGSVGTASIQVARAFGATVTAICSSANFDLVKSLGADFVIDYRQEDFTEFARFDHHHPCGFIRNREYPIIGCIAHLQCRHSNMDSFLMIYHAFGHIKVSKI